MREHSGQRESRRDKPLGESGIFLLKIQDDLQLILSVKPYLSLKPSHRGTTQFSRQFHARYQDGEAKTLLKNTIRGRAGHRFLLLFSPPQFSNNLEKLLFLLGRIGRKGDL